MDFSIVIPAYNEARRLCDTLSAVSEFLNSCPQKGELIIVNDGSKDGTAGILKRFVESHQSVRVIENERNLGKGASVKRGVLAARGAYIFFMDADLSVPIEEMEPCLETMMHNQYPILIGSRRAIGSRIVRRQPMLREGLGHVFTYLTRFLLTYEILDFTCGFKGFRRDVAQLLFSVQQCSGWAFDAEILYFAKLFGLPVHQQPVRWEHREDSRVRFPADLWRTLFALAEIRLRSPMIARQQAKILGTLSQETRGV